MSVYVHNLNPFLLQFTETLGLRWYSLAYLAGFFLGYLSVRFLIQRKATIISEIELADLVVYVALGTLLGGRIGYALFYSPDLITDFTSTFPYWGVLKVYEGGMASHGGIFGILLAISLFCKQRKKPYWHLADLCVFGGSLGIFFGRIANFINGELYGREVAAGALWAVKFPQEMYLWTHKNVNQLLQVAPAAEALGQLKGMAGETVQVTADIWREWVMSYRMPQSSSFELVNHGIESIIKAIQSGNTRVAEALAPALTARYPSQLYQAVLEGLLIFAIMVFVWRKPQKPGVVSGWFGFVYCIGRIIGEQFRMPDPQIGFQLLGLTRGQWLSFGMLAVALIWLGTAYKRKVEPMGGWSRVR